MFRIRSGEHDVLKIEGYFVREAIILVLELILKDQTWDKLFIVGDIPGTTPLGNYHCYLPECTHTDLEKMIKIVKEN